MVNTCQVTKEIPDGQTRRIGSDPAPATKVTMISAFAYRRPNELIHQWVSRDAYWALPLMGEGGQGHSQLPRRAGSAPRPTHGASAAGSGGAERRCSDRSIKDYPVMRQTHTCSAAVGASAMSDVHHNSHTSPVAGAAYHRVGGWCGGGRTRHPSKRPLLFLREDLLPWQNNPVPETAARFETCEAGLTAEATLSNRIAGYSDYF